MSIYLLGKLKNGVYPILLQPCTQPPCRSGLQAAIYSVDCDLKIAITKFTFSVKLGAVDPKLDGMNRPMSRPVLPGLFAG